MIPLHDVTSLFIVVLGISLLPFVAMVVTSYAKIVVVLGLLRNALGVQQVPPNMVLNGIAILASIYIMGPMEISAMNAVKNHRIGGDSTNMLFDAIEVVRPQFQEFLSKHTRDREKIFFLKSAKVIWPKEQAEKLSQNDLIVLAPAFTLSELTDAFRIGFILYLAFIVVDLIIANILISMGLNQVQPSNVAIPFKLLLFVMLDGWSVLIHGLIMTYR
ncbi:MULTISPECIES: type III secretion system export apparatus subunit SctR [unclassified Caballeronia]|uniref:type III secretion system export apparatus subunit SctR n=1 Tax=unclassified Caballeronia TaxID=2646786 RepID=UPI002027C5F3|nr:MULTISPECIES: type III secretion system export apparatus subunit SctR [unclassified Caballeronia]